MKTLQQFDCLVNGIKVAIYQTDPSKKPVILLHANSASHRHWIHQLQSRAFTDYNLIAIDFPGCGNSDNAPHPEADYTVMGLAESVLGVMDELSIGHHVIVGHSLGGHVALELCRLTSDVKGIVIFGAPPLKCPLNTQEAFLAYKEIGLLFQPKLSEDEAAVLQAGLTCNEQEYPIAADLLTTDPNFRTFIGKSLVETRGISNEMEIFESLEIPVAILHGKSDPVINLSYLKNLDSRKIWSSNVITRDQCGHYPQLEAPDWFNGHLLAFLEHLHREYLWQA